MSAVDHAQATELFSSYWDEEIAPTDAAALEEHLRSCVVCRREYEQFEHAVGALGSLPKQLAPQGFARGVVKRVHERSRGRLFRPRSLIDRVPYELFSLVMLGLILAVYLILQLSQPGRVQIP
jgi:anti-sigma factor RsiW